MSNNMVTNQIADADVQLTDDEDKLVRAMIEEACMREAGKRPEDIREALGVNQDRMLVLFKDGTYLDLEWEVVSGGVGVQATVQ